jgi:hypothetical protein
MGMDAELLAVLMPNERKFDSIEKVDTLLAVRTPVEEKLEVESIPEELEADLRPFCIKSDDADRVASPDMVAPCPKNRSE